MQDRERRVELSQELLEVYIVNAEDFYSRLVTGGQAWRRHWDPNTKKESMQWQVPCLCPPKKFCTQLAFLELRRE